MKSEAAKRHHTGPRAGASADTRLWFERYDQIVAATGMVLYDASGDGTAVAYGGDLEGMLGYDPEELAGAIASWVDLVHPDDRARFEAEVESVRAEGCCDFQYRVRHRDGSYRTVRDRGIAMRGDPGRVLGLLEDVTEREAAERERQASQEKFAKIFEFSPVSMSITTIDGVYLAINERFVERTGLSRDEVIGRHASELDVTVRPEDYEEFRRRMARDGFVRDLEMTVSYRDGRVRTSYVSSVIVDVGGEPCLLNAGVDITDRIQAEEELRRRSRRIRELAGRLITLQEEERTRIARELHDDFSQKVAAIAIALSNVKRKAQGGQDVASALDALRERTISLASDIRKLSHRLHPSALAHAGLVASLREYCEEFEQLTGIRASFSATGVPEALPPDVELCLFRVGQEALRNAAKHSGSASAEVSLSHADGELVMEVRDRGRGFDAGALQGRDGLGLVSMEERVHLVGGTLAVFSEPGRGTTVRASVPFDMESR
jgi:PAS domain S-box-containing protein